jgi:AcrR family transcriptional regulator
MRQSTVVVKNERSVYCSGMPRVSAEHKAARRQQILTAALHCAAREGFHKTTMAHVIAESGLSAGAVYGYFRSKTELIRALSEIPIGGLREAIDAQTGAAEPVSPAVALERVLGRVDVLSAALGEGLPRVAVQAWAEAARDEGVRAVLADQLSEVRASWRRLLERAQAAGLVAADADLDEMAQTMMGLMPGFVLQRLILGDVTPSSYAAGLVGLTR